LGVWRALGLRDREAFDGRRFALIQVDRMMVYVAHSIPDRREFLLGQVA
jgi:hypothetical protein